MINELVKNKIQNINHLYSNITGERKEILDEFAKYIFAKSNRNEIINIIFICTHNSRRSTMSQIWAQTAAEYFDIPNIFCYSGGTEVTAFNPRAVKAVREMGFRVEQKDESENPVYEVYYSEEKDPLKCFSKVYSDEFNPQKDFIAVMTCSNAEQNCPVVFGADAKFSIKYEDPKNFDGTDLEEEKYRERFLKIGTEMFYIFDKVKNGGL